MMTIGTSYFKKRLVGKFVPKVNNESKTQVVKDLYNKYKKQLSQPKLTTRSLTKAMRYIKKHNLKESQYKEAIKKTATTAPALTLDQFSDIYDYVMKKHSVKYALNRKNVLGVYNFIISCIVKTVNSGDKLRLSHFGVFEGMTRQARKYRVPGTNKSVLVKKHLVPKFRPSTVWKKQLRK